MEITTTNVKHYFQGGYDCQFVEPFDGKFECPICLLCQRDPYQTACGHRFCHSCIVTWLSEGKTCPDDNTTISINEIFPDAIAKREIQQLKVRCSNFEKGCDIVFQLSEQDEHLAKCPHQSPAHVNNGHDSTTCPQCGDILDKTIATSHQTLVCPNVTVACSFLTVGCDRKILRKDYQEHMEKHSVSHMKLLAEKLTKVQQLQQAERVFSCNCQTEEEEYSANSLPSSPLQRNYQGVRMSGSNLHSQTRLIRELYQKVINLEQGQCQNEIKISHLTTQIENLQFEKEEILSKSHNGEFLWRIRDFTSYHQKLRNNHSFVIYSKGFYTSFYGYKVCMRSNLYISEGEEYLGIFVHFMRGENDDILFWPWKGNIRFTLINQQYGPRRANIIESMDSVIGSEAFKRPEQERNMVGFGFQTFVRINSLYTGGFVDSSDTLVVKAKLSTAQEDCY